MTEVTIPPWRMPPATLVTARSYLIDRILPDCEIVALPAKDHGGGVLRYGRKRLSELPSPDTGGRLARLKPKGTLALDDGAVFDFRRNDPSNWAHFLTNHLPLYFHLLDVMDLSREDTRIVTPASTPQYIQDAAAFFGVPITASDARLDGAGVAFDLSPWTALRATRSDWVATAPARAALKQGLKSATSTPLPRRIFLSRQDRRRIENEDAILPILSERGFERIYAETLPVADQMRLFQEAEAIVAIHGAALGPLLWRTPDSALRTLIEILPCGHMTDVFRAMAAQVGVSWFGVRGRLKPEYVSAAYAFDTPFRAHSLDDFEVDPVSLEHALDLAGVTAP